MIEYKCEADFDLPESVHLDDVKKVEVKTCIGWIDCTDDFTYTLNGNDYRFTF